MKNIFRARRSLKSVYTANAIVQLVIYFLIAFAVSEFRMRILLLPFKSPLIVLILILSLIGASALTSVSTHVEFEEISKLSKSMNAVASGDFGFQLETRSGIDEIKDAYRSFNIMVEELDMINTLQRDFVSNVSHEFKTPINVIEGYLTLLRTPGLSEEERTFYIDKIQSNTHRLSTLVGSVLLLSKLESQSISRRELYSLDEQIRQTVLDYEPRWEEKNLEPDLELDSVTYFGDEEILSHVWSNLIDNAIKYSESGGRIILRMTERAGVIFVTVEDEGLGIPEEAKERIFEKFYQADSSHGSEGNGLGLALVRQILDRCGGAISVENRPEGGAKFTVVLTSCDKK